MCVFNLDLNTVNEKLHVMAREFQMVGAVQRKAQSAKRVLVVPSTFITLLLCVAVFHSASSCSVEICMHLQIV